MACWWVNQGRSYRVSRPAPPRRTKDWRHRGRLATSFACVPCADRRRRENVERPNGRPSRSFSAAYVSRFSIAAKPVSSHSVGSLALFSTFGTPPSSCRLGSRSTALPYSSMRSIGMPASFSRFAVKRDHHRNHVPPRRARRHGMSGSTRNWCEFIDCRHCTGRYREAECSYGCHQTAARSWPGVPGRRVDVTPAGRRDRRGYQPEHPMKGGLK
jgi:hypothetical protein